MDADLNRVVRLFQAYRLALRQVSVHPCEEPAWGRHDPVQGADRHHVLGACLAAGRTGCFLDVGHHRVVLDAGRWCLPWIGRGCYQDEALVLSARVLVPQACPGQVLVRLLLLRPVLLQVLLLQLALAQAWLPVLESRRQVLARPLAALEPALVGSEL